MIKAYFTATSWGPNCESNSKGRTQTWVRVCNRCSAACSSGHICLWFQDRRSETQRQWVHQHFQQHRDVVSQHVCRSDSVSSVMGLLNVDVAFTCPGTASVAQLAVEQLKQQLQMCPAQAARGTFYSLPTEWHFPQSGHFSKKTFYYNRPLFPCFRPSSSDEM